MRKSVEPEQFATPKRVLARLLAKKELAAAIGGGDTTWTNGPPRPDITQISAGDKQGDPPAE
jgi:hypothetical protein